jgi:hypothetical protein
VFRGLKSEPTEGDWRLLPQNELVCGLLYENFIGTSGVVMRKDLAMTLGGFDETLANGDDLDLWFRLAHCCDAVYSPSVGHAYRVHSTSVIHARPSAIPSPKVLRRERLSMARPGSTSAAGPTYSREPCRHRWFIGLIAAALLEPEGDR